SYAWTGLADGLVVEKEARLPGAAGGRFSFIHLEFDEEPKEVYIQKYGMGKFRDLVHTLAWKLFNSLQDISMGALIGQYADDSFVLLINPKDEEKIKERVIVEAELVIEGFYNAEDRGRKGVLKKDFKSGNEIVVPLINLVWKKNEKN
ncbi:MAG: hypothetical protein N2445_06250, partial [Acidobacteria bacterium]|nr:hypothetical protein [Acidobacteriota bacterium]